MMMQERGNNCKRKVFEVKEAETLHVSCAYRSNDSSSMVTGRKSYGYRIFH